MNSRTWSVITLSVVVSLALVASGCGATTPEPTAEPEAKIGEPYKIGAMFSITGGTSTMGVPQRNTLQMLHKELEAAGGIMGPDGLMHPIELIIYDTESDETKAVLAAKKLIEEDQVSVIIGPSQSGTSLAVLDSVQKAEVPLISVAASGRIIEPAAERKWVFKTPRSDRILAKLAMEYLKSQGITKVAWLSVNNAFGDSGKVEVEAAAPDYGITIVASEKFEAADTDMTAQLTKIRGTGAEMLFMWALLPGGAIAQKNAFDLGLEIPILNHPAPLFPGFIELATAEAAEGVFSFGNKVPVAEQLPDSDPQKAVLMKYLADYQAAYNAESDQFGALASDAFKLAVRAMEKAGSDRAAIRDELEKTQGFLGTCGIYNMSPSDHNGLDVDGLVVVQIVNGELKLVEP
jgi:branched-chain amino acid transport system substrate-binding protein